MIPEHNKAWKIGEQVAAGAGEAKRGRPGVPHNDDIHGGQRSLFGDIREMTMDKLSRFRKVQDDLFKQHLTLEDIPGKDADLLDQHFDDFQADPEQSAENRFKPLGDWFQKKEDAIQKLTGKLENACKMMVQINDTAAARIPQIPQVTPRSAQQGGASGQM